MKFPKLNLMDMVLWLLQFLWAMLWLFQCWAEDNKRPPAEWEWLIRKQQSFPKKDLSSPSSFILAGEMSRLCFSALCPSLHIFQSNNYVMVFFPLNKEKHPTFSIPAAIACINNDQEQQHMWCCLANRWEGSLPLGCPRCAVSVASCSWLLHQQLTMPGTQVQLLEGQCVLALWHASSKPCDRNCLLEQEFLMCPLLVEEIDHKDTRWVKRSFRLSSCLLPHCQLWEESSCY